MNEHDEAEWTKNESQTEDHEETNTSLEEQTSKPLDDTEEVPMPEETKIHEKEKVTPTIRILQKTPMLMKYLKIPDI